MSFLSAKRFQKLGTGWRRRPLWGLLGCAILLSMSKPASAQVATINREYQIKAVFLYNLIQFVSWPNSLPAAATSDAEPIIIGVVGDDPFGALLDETVAGENVGGRSVAIRRWARAEEIETCHVLFIARSEATRLAEVLNVLAQSPVLTVGDFRRFAEDGGMVGLVTSNNRVRLEVNLAAARASGLKMDSNLLRSATIVNAEGGN